jgi:hypothetical protein
MAKGDRHDRLSLSAHKGCDRRGNRRDDVGVTLSPEQTAKIEEAGRPVAIL